MHKYIWKTLWQSSSLQSYWVLEIWQSTFSELTNNSCSSSETWKMRNGNVIKYCSHPHVEHRITEENIGRDILGHLSSLPQIQVSFKCYKSFLRGFSTWLANNSKDGDPTASLGPVPLFIFPVLQWCQLSIYLFCSPHSEVLSDYSHPLDRGHQVSLQPFLQDNLCYIMCSIPLNKLASLCHRSSNVSQTLVCTEVPIWN